MPLKCCEKTGPNTKCQWLGITQYAKVRNEFMRIRKIIESQSTPFKSVEIITNSAEAKAHFEAMLKELVVPGTVRLAP